MPAVYQHWLDEDVRWIISAEEKRAFESLKDNQERDQFITQFWLRRDPTPGTSENEFKEEHYRRLAYSNEHFAAGVLGDLTDRGRVYIVYGPPDLIDHPAISVTPKEIWHYEVLAQPGHFVGYEGKQPPSRNPADFEFVDTCRCGDYHLMTPLPK